ncbi:His/Gly/Thr/Pro-type tRNA ligase C-terminal domain-containing protein, partial [Acinetobacter baumannii]
DYAKDIVAKLRRAGLRVTSDLRNEKINLKVRELSLAKVPVILVIGKREAEEGKVAIRRLGSQDNKVMTFDEALAMLKDEAIPPDVRREMAEA